MFYIRFKNGLPVEVANTLRKGEVQWARTIKDTGWRSSKEFATYADAKKIAAYLTFLTGDTYIGADNESGSAEAEFKVIKAPSVGDEVSKSFNGDSYPCGVITKITPSWIITTSTGAKFRRYGESGAWREQGRGFWMIYGHVDERNPHF